MPERVQNARRASNSFLFLLIRSFRVLYSMTVLLKPALRIHCTFSIRVANRPESFCINIIYCNNSYDLTSRLSAQLLFDKRIINFIRTLFLMI